MTNIQLILITFKITLIYRKEKKRKIKKYANYIFLKIVNYQNKKFENSLILVQKVPATFRKKPFLMTSK
jgi:hypothetical protein